MQGGNPGRLPGSSEADATPAESVTMKWTLIVMALDTTPVETQLFFDDLDSCYRAEETMRIEFTRAFNDWEANADPRAAGFQAAREQLRKRIATGLCIPHAAPRP
jgi:hypothetical protein